MVSSSTIALNAIHRQAQLGRLYAQAEVTRMAVYHYKKVAELYHAAPDDVRKATQTAYEEAGSKLVELEVQIPVPEPKPIQPRSNVIMLWLYKYKKASKLSGYGKIK